MFAFSPACPTCRSHAIHRSHGRVLDLPLRLFGLRPFRCALCAHRFFGLRDLRLSAA